MDEFAQGTVRCDLKCTDTQFVFRGLLALKPAPAPFNRSNILTIRPVWLAKNCSSFDLFIERCVADFQVLDTCIAVSKTKHSKPIDLAKGEVLKALTVEGVEDDVKICFVRDRAAYWCNVFLKDGSRALSRVGAQVLGRYRAINKDVPLRRTFLKKGRKTVGKEKRKVRLVLKVGAKANAIDFRKDARGAKHILLQFEDLQTGWANFKDKDGQPNENLEELAGFQHIPASEDACNILAEVAAPAGMYLANCRGVVTDMVV